MTPTWRIVEGDCRERLRELEPGSAQTCVTSPPYFGLRDYGNDGQIGLEPTPDEFVSTLVDVFREVRRVLADDGTLWLNLGDSYAAGKTGRTDHGSGDPTSRLGPERDGLPNGAQPGPVALRPVPLGMKPKDLIGIPWMVAFALRADGWFLRSDIIWHKPNPMPESITDRPTKAHEYLFLLAKSQRYHYDGEAIKEPATYPEGSGNVQPVKGALEDPEKHRTRANLHLSGGRETRNKRTVWTVTSQPFPGAHFATFPPKLIEPCILAGAPEGGTVLDPFAGAGTTGVVALRRNRAFVGLELNPEYAELARNRIRDDAPLLNSPAEVDAPSETAA